MTELGPRLRQMRLQAGLTQIEMSERLGLKQAQISAIEVGRRTTTLVVFENWLAACGATATIERPDARDPRTAVAGELAGLDTAQLDQVARIIRAIKRLNEDERERETWMLEARAGLVGRSKQ